jgi:hypothetical protein
VQSRVIRERLMKEAEVNVAIKVADTPGGEAFEVSGRGELQMGVLIENMRREGFELSISRPRVIFRDIDGVRMEPVEEVIIDVDDEYSGAVIDKLTGERKGDLVEMKPAGVGKTRIIAHVPSRGLIGYQGQFLTDTRGTGVLNRIFHGWAPHKGPIQGRRQGVLISMEAGVSVAYALWNLEDRGRMFIGPQEQVYVGMIIGEHSRDNDLEVNPLKGKKLTNVRASGTDEAVRLTPPVKMSLEEAIAYIDDDELVEVTPKIIRLRKRFLDPNERKRYSAATLPRLQHVLQVAAGVAVLDLRHSLGRAGGDDLAAAVAALGADVDDPVGGFDHVQVVFDHHHRVALSTSSMQHFQQLAHILEVQAGGGFVEDIERAAGRCPADSSFDSFTRCASPPDRVVACWPTLT